jgi:tetratricopeptide (TPR) repeat protein
MNLLVEIALAVLTPIPALLAAWTVHEVSHWGVLRVLGVPVVGLRLGPFLHEGGRWRWDIRWELRAGFVGYVKPDFERTSPDGLRARHLAVCASGPAGQLLTGVVVALLALRSGAWSLWPAAVLVWMATLVELLPLAAEYEGSERWSDGKTLWRWLVAPGSTANRSASSALIVASAAGRRPRDLDRRWVDLAVGIEPTSVLQVASWLVAFTSALDQGDLVRARPLLDVVYAARELLNPAQRLRAVAWAAYTAARFDRDVDRATDILAGEADWSADEWFAELARAALDEAAGRPDAALTRCDWLLNTQWRPGDGFGALLREQVEALGAEVARATPTSSPGDLGAVPVAMASTVAGALNDKAGELSRCGELDEAAEIYGEVVRRFGSVTNPELRVPAMSALLNRGVALAGLGRREEWIAAYKEVVRRYRASPSPELREHVAKALGNIQAALGDPDSRGEVIAACRETVALLGDATEPWLQARVAYALAREGYLLGELERHDEAIAVDQQVELRFGHSADPELCRLVATAIRNRAVALRRLHRYDEAVGASAEVARRYGDADSPEARNQVSAAFSEMTISLRALGRHDEAMAVYDEILERFGRADEPDVRMRVAYALARKGHRLADIGRPAEATLLYDEILGRFGDDDGSVLAGPLALALRFKAEALRKVGRPWDAVAAEDEVIRRFGGRPDPALRDSLDRARASRRRALAGGKQPLPQPPHAS